MTGFRVHPGGAQTLFGVKPDITALGKVIGGGLPVGAYGGRRDIMQMVAPVGPMYQAGTLSGNPLAMTAGIETLKAIQEAGVWEKMETAGAQLIEGLTQAAKKASIPVTHKSAGHDVWHVLPGRASGQLGDGITLEYSSLCQLFSGDVGEWRLHCAVAV